MFRSASYTCIVASIHLSSSLHNFFKDKHWGTVHFTFCLFSKRVSSSSKAPQRNAQRRELKSFYVLSINAHRSFCVSESLIHLYCSLHPPFMFLTQLLQRQALRYSARYFCLFSKRVSSSSKAPQKNAQRRELTSFYVLSINAHWSFCVSEGFNHLSCSPHPPLVFPSSTFQVLYAVSSKRNIEVQYIDVSWFMFLSSHSRLSFLVRVGMTFVDHSQTSQRNIPRHWTQSNSAQEPNQY